MLLAYPQSVAGRPRPQRDADGSFAFIQQPTDERGESTVPGGRRDRRVHGAIAVEKILDRIRLVEVDRLIHLPRQAIQLRGRHPSRRGGGRRRFDEKPQVVDLAYVTQRQGCDDMATTRLGPHETLGAEAGQSRPHRRLGQAEPVDELLFGHRGCRCQFESQDRSAKPVMSGPTRGDRGSKRHVHSLLTCQMPYVDMSAMSISVDGQTPASPRVPTEHLIRYGGEFADLLIERAEGSWLTTEDGRRILDFTSGQMCATLGHGHPAIIDALRQSSGKLVHLFSGFLCRDVTELARELMATLPPPLARAMFLSTGGEANEAALRLAKLHTGGHEVLAFTGSWHGMTAGAVASTYSAGRRGYGPAVPGTMVLPTPNPYRCPIRHCRDRCDFTCLDVGMALADAQSVGAPAAVIAEPLLSVGGIVPLPPGYLARLRDHCRERGMLLILDEAQTGLGRVGTMYAFEQHDVVPDILTLSKTLGGGLPLSATVTTAEIEDDVAAKGFLHFTSHVSDPLPAAVGRAVLRTVLTEDLPARAAKLGERLRAGLSELGRRHEPVGDVRGQGLMLGVDLVRDRTTRKPAPRYATAVTARCLELGLNVNIVKFPGLGSVLRIAPPLTVSTDEIDLALEILDRALTDMRHMLDETS